MFSRVHGVITQDVDSHYISEDFRDNLALVLVLRLKKKESCTVQVTVSRDGSVLQNFNERNIIVLCTST